ncbi:CYFA0S03e02762g1_1 [Cyberlindnera fabianii]|uniref:CYFA0S03e02762g1_1 n=1 Tax=Cyberlindnera fabianii TaxID=36022 RepID=A0A061AQF7_CYBFA|nr:NADPH-dependent 1-acyldihydroxyacetone phosphate reductase [Cyberlindnera fabianii]CDR39389.1 CYFA0S03e02762g1_1 [Cyberlindnera fabianii]
MTKTVLIVGASTGIGFHLAKEFAKRGYKVYAGSRSLSKMDPLKTLGVITFPLDITSSESIASAKALIETDNAGILDILYLNAGIGGKGPLFDADMGEVRGIYETNFFGPMTVLQTFDRIIVKNKTTVVFTSTVAVLLNMPWNFSYSSSKMSFDFLAKQLVMETCRLGVKVVNIRTGSTESEIWTDPYRPPKSSIYAVEDDEPFGIPFAPNKMATEKYAKRAVDVVEKAIKSGRYYSVAYEGEGATMAWWASWLPYTSIMVPWMYRMFGLEKIMNNARKNLDED